MERNRACGARVGLREGEVAAHALLGGDLTWLLPDNLSELKAFRDSHALEGIRELFRVRRRTLQRAGADDLQAASEEMVAAVYQAVQEALKELETGRNSDITTIGLRVIEVASSIGLSVLTTVLAFHSRSMFPSQHWCPRGQPGTYRELRWNGCVTSMVFRTNSMFYGFAEVAEWRAFQHFV